MRDLQDEPARRMRRWVHVLLVIAALILLALLISTRATAFVIVPLEQEAEMSPPGGDQIIYARDPRLSPR